MRVKIDCETTEGDYVEVRHNAGLITIIVEDTSLDVNTSQINMVDLTPEKARGLINEISKAIKAEEK